MGETPWQIGQLVVMLGTVVGLCVWLVKRSEVTQAAERKRSDERLDVLMQRTEVRIDALHRMSHESLQNLIESQEKQAERRAGQMESLINEVRGSTRVAKAIHDNGCARGRQARKGAAEVDTNGQR